MNTDLLRTFLEVSRTRHFGQAAENLHLTQSAVSFRIRQLEELIGSPLFSRERNNILLTPSGERLIAHAENILTAWQLALQDVGVPQLQHAQLAIGGTSNLWDTYLQKQLPSLAEHFHELYFRTEINTSQLLVRSLLAGRIDVAVMLDPPKVSHLEVTRIDTLELVFVCNQAGKTQEHIGELGQVFVDWGTAINLQQAKLFATPTAPLLHTGQSYIALEFLLSRGGAAFLPKHLVRQYLESKQLFPVKQVPAISNEIYAIYSHESERARHLAPVIDRLIASKIK